MDTYTYFRKNGKYPIKKPNLRLIYKEATMFQPAMLIALAMAAPRMPNRGIRKKFMITLATAPISAIFLNCL